MEFSVSGWGFYLKGGNQIDGGISYGLAVAVDEFTVMDQSYTGGSEFSSINTKYKGGVSSSEPIDLESGPDELNHDNLKSAQWTHFERKNNGGNMTATCIHCPKTPGAKPKNGTTHLHTLLDRCKRLRQSDVRHSRIMGKANAKPGLRKYTFYQEFARRELRSMIILHEYLLSIADYVEFRRYSSAYPLFKVPTRHNKK
ncbi:hypothetical protein RJ639_027893 [Escallonia herrerae]|uniref:Uncharacterized protein n=1 Tax=Escallonia herrerae TaxID=1293975 RepID=A0AA88XCP4_9ASTE|nr:hypothetical protein RJ639_027893 [Escallonia herrerae]